MKKLLFFFALICLTNFTNAQWQQTTCPYSGSIFCFAIKGDTIFVGSGGGISYSTDNGNSWAMVNTGLNGSSVHALAINGSNIFAGSTYQGVFLSSNNGSSWTAVNNGLQIDTTTSIYIPALATNGNNIFAGKIGAVDEYGLYKSTNNGSNWDTAGLINIYNGVEAIAVKGDTIFAGIFCNGGIYRSFNNGNSWTQVNSGLPSNTNVVTIAIYANNIFIGSDQNGIFLSTNNGGNWTAVNSGLINNSVRTIAISGNNIIAGTAGNGVFLSSNNGQLWSAINNGLPSNANISSIAISGIYIFAGTNNNGVWRMPLSQLGIDGMNINNSISVYPIPAINNITIESMKKSTIEILNMQGQSIQLQWIQQGKTDIDISGLTKGVYILRLLNNDKTEVTKIVKE